MPTILYEDNHILAVYKPNGMLVQGDRTKDPTLFDAAKRYIKETRGKPGNVFLGLVHRLDRPVSGAVVFARTSKAASRLTEAFSRREVKKVYLAVVEGALEEAEGEAVAHIVRSRRRSRTAPASAPKAKEAFLTYKTMAYVGKTSLIEVHPATGRHHQIRLQLASMGHPIVGDIKYGSKISLPRKAVALHAWRISFIHPVKKIPVEVEAEPPAVMPWIRFDHMF